MKLNGRTITDDEIIIDVQKAVDAFERFKEKRGRSPKGQRVDEGGPAFDFDRAIRSWLQRVDVIVPPAGMVLASKQTFSKWKLDPPRDQIKKKRSVLLAILSITGIDISAQSTLARMPINLSPMTELAPLRSKKLTNDPDEVDEVTFEIELAELVFKSSEMTIMSDWIIMSSGNVKKGEAFEAGTVVFGLKEADIEINFGDTEPVDWTRRISAETDPFLGRTDACVVLWNQERNAWTVQPTEGSPMRVRVENVKLCKTNGKRGAFVDLTVTTHEAQMYSDFKMKRQLGNEGTPEASATGTLSGAQLYAARDRLFSIVLAHRPDDASILSYQRHKLP